MKKFEKEFILLQSHIETYFFYKKQIDPAHYMNSLVLHNSSHAERVLILVIILASLLNLSNYELDILCMAAVYHDIGRKNDYIDPIHGFNSWRKYIKKVNNSCNVLNEKQKIVRYIIINHCLDLENEIKLGEDYRKYNNLLSVFKDADALDRVRNQKLDICFLRYKESIALIPFALDLYVNENDFLSYLEDFKN